MGASVNKEIAGALIPPLRKRYIRKHFTHERRKKRGERGNLLHDI